MKITVVVVGVLVEAIVTFVGKTPEKHQFKLTIVVTRSARNQSPLSIRRAKKIETFSDVQDSMKIVFKCNSIVSKKEEAYLNKGTNHLLRQIEISDG